ncbi:hypothetical protein [Subtercola boreus]|uniref:Uncharacterized protein n=1 Tax=Subtercola boreus TaxID=120213 RepID=A0A3E0W8E2_9MICO|nr:hypothetical protein [Subtercola boreus]RFA19091.1 hypothetical protein B7R24_13255 [Subtercola boreus]RFA19229.1 hypothetical protein B7R23_13235 [Subtercola boreus]RFA25691.1 hypothetical protein B7R25_13355 [Subtercola boreus]
MRVVAYILTIVIATALMLGGTLVVAFNTPRPLTGSTLAIALAVGAISVFIYGPVLLGSLTAYWNVRRSDDAKRYFRRFTLVVLGLDVLGVAAIILYSVITGAPLWIPVLFIVVAAVLMVAARLVGPWLLRRDEARPHPKDDWRPIEHREIMRKIVIIAATFAGFLVIGLVVFGAVLQARADLSGFGRALLTSAQFASIASAFAGIIVSLPLNRQLRSITDRDLGLTRKFGMVVLRRKSIELDDRETTLATKYAAVMSVILSFQIGYFVLLYLGLGLGQVQSIASGRTSPFAIGLPLFLVVALLVLVPLLVVRIRRARRYAAEHAHLLTDAPGPVAS